MNWYMSDHHCFFPLNNFFFFLKTLLLSIIITLVRLKGSVWSRQVQGGEWVKVTHWAGPRPPKWPPAIGYEYKCFHFIFIVVVICLYLFWICVFSVFTYRRPSLKLSRCPPQHLPGRWKSLLWKAASQKPQTAARWRTTARVLRPEESTARKCGNTTGKQTEWLIFGGKAEQ